MLLFQILSLLVHVLKSSYNPPQYHWCEKGITSEVEDSLIE